MSVCLMKRNYRKGSENMLIIGFEQKVNKKDMELEKELNKEGKFDLLNVHVFCIGDFDGDDLFIIDNKMTGIVAAIDAGMEIEFEPIAKDDKNNPYRGLTAYQAMSRNVDNHYYYYWLHNGDYLSELELEEIYRGSA